MFSSTLLGMAKAHALADFPNESCGIVVGNTYIPCTNIANDPLVDFEIAESVTQPYIEAGTLQAVIHSHPFAQIKRKSAPSANDMRGQIATNVPWGIIDTDGTVVNDPYWFGDFTLDEPLIGVEFQHGVRDCYSAIRKWYWQIRGIKLIDVARDDRWWLNADNLYIDNFARAGFVKVSLSALQDGDVVLGKVNSQKLNHAGIYLDNTRDGKGLFYHHLPGRLSRREPAHSWVNRAEIALRYVGEV